MNTHPPLYKYLIELPYGTETQDAKELLRTVHAITSPTHHNLGIPYIPHIKRKGYFSPSLCFATTPTLAENFTRIFQTQKFPSYYRIRQASSAEFRSYAIRLMAGEGPYHNTVPDNALHFLRKCGALLGRKTLDVSIDYEIFKQRPFQAFSEDAKKVDGLLRETAYSTMKVANCSHLQSGQNWTIESKKCLAIVVDNRGVPVSTAPLVTQKAIPSTLPLRKKARKLREYEF